MAETGIDFQGLSLLIGALAGLLVAAGGLIIPIMNFLREERRLRAEQALTAQRQRDELAKTVVVVAEKVDAVAKMGIITHELVNGTSEAIKQAKEDIGFLKGVQVGKEQERANPLTPAVVAPEVERKP